MLVNSDRFLLVSNQRSYFNDQKNFYKFEIERLTNLYEKAYHKKRSYKKNYKELIVLKEDLVLKYEREIMYLKQNLFTDKKDILVQTEIDTDKFKEIRKNNDLVIFHKKLVRN